MAKQEHKKWARVMILGHSFARRFRDFLLTDKFVQPHLGLSDCTVQVHGVGGWKVTDMMRDGESRIELFWPEMLFLMIGDNDVGKGHSPETIAAHVLASASLLKKRYAVEEVKIVQLWPRYPGTEKRKGLTAMEYNAQAVKVNEELENGARELTGIKLLSFDFVAFPCQDLQKYKRLQSNYKEDGVHLNPSGQFRLYRSLQTAVIKA
jgi:lysophospholipase L1-like esterase